jgi:hypothetical protein
MVNQDQNSKELQFLRKDFSYSYKEISNDIFKDALFSAFVQRFIPNFLFENLTLPNINHLLKMKKNIIYALTILLMMTLFASCAKTPSQPWQPPKHKKQNLNRIN